MKLFESIDVWGKRNGVVCRYRCFRVLPDEGYCVQSLDYYPEGHAGARELEKQFMDLFYELAPNDRSGMFSTLEAAILNFDEEFGIGR